MVSCASRLCCLESASASLLFVPSHPPEALFVFGLSFRADCMMGYVFAVHAMKDGYMKRCGRELMIPF